MASNLAHDNIIDAIYDVAIDTEDYEKLIDAWNKIDHSDYKFEDVVRAHIKRAARLLENAQLKESVTFDKSQQSFYLNDYFLTDKNGLIIDVNEVCSHTLDIKQGDIFDHHFSIEGYDNFSDIIFLNKNQMCTIFHNNKHKKAIFYIKPISVQNGVSVQNGDKAFSFCGTNINWLPDYNSALKRIYGLTKTECVIAKELVTGLSISAISHLRGKSITTIRAQLRSIFFKTSTDSQADLIRTITGLILLLREETSVNLNCAKYADKQNHQKEASPKSFNLKGYPSIEILEYGDPTGRPILVFHDELIGDAFIYFLLKTTPKAKNYRYWVILRPGYGNSKFDDRIDVPKLITEVAFSLATQYSCHQPVPLLAHGNGFFFALKSAVRLEGLCSHIVAVSPMLPVLAEDQMDDMPKYHRFIRSTIKNSPAMGEFAIKAGYKLFKTIGPLMFAKIIYNHSKDIELLSNLYVQEALIYGARLHNSSHQPLLSDELSVSSDWMPLVQSKLPTINLLFGENEVSSTWKRLAILEENITKLNIRRRHASTLPAFSEKNLYFDLIETQLNISVN